MFLGRQSILEVSTLNEEFKMDFSPNSAADLEYKFVPSKAFCASLSIPTAV